MNYKMIGRLIALILAVEAFFMLPPMIICFVDGDYIAARAFIYSILIAIVVGALLHLLTRDAKPGFYAREGLVTVSMCWIVLSLVGCLPFIFSGDIPRFIDALFEIVSGFTTTGASILTDVGIQPRGILFWRSFSHWLGGMGVLVFLLAVVPISGRNDGFTMHILRAESPGPTVGKLVPRMRQTASILYLLYIMLTVMNILFLLPSELNLFESMCIAFGTAGTGGFGLLNASCGDYSPYVQIVTTVFMVLFGINFSCYYLLLLGNVKDVFKDEELRLYLGVIFVSIALVTLNIRRMYSGTGEALRHAAFQVSSIITTTGYSTTDFDLWPGLSKGIIMTLMVFGACAGSTGGGIKMSRVLLLLKSLRRNIRQVIRPNRVQAVRINGRPVGERVLTNTNAYLSAYVVIIIVSYLVVSLDNFSIGTNLSAVLACFNNIGPGLEAVGPTCSYAGYSDLSKLVLTVDMLAGRLEIFPILALFSRGAWKK